MSAPKELLIQMHSLPRKRGPFSGNTQNFNQRFSAKLANICKQIHSARHKLELAQASLGDWCVENHPHKAVPPEMASEFSVFQHCINNLESLEQMFRNFNKIKSHYADPS